ncbi:hypothetical protein [Alkalihalobacterium sp. APHAB7]
MKKYGPNEVLKRGYFTENHHWFLHILFSDIHTGCDFPSDVEK